jgi:hypothetical protein
MQLHLAVNDDDGNHTGRVAVVQVVDLFELEGPGAYDHMADTHCQHAAGTLTIGERSWPIDGYATWVGNIVWDCAHVSADVVAEIVNYLRTLPDWDCIEAESSLYDKWNRRELFSGGELAELDS